MQRLPRLAVAHQQSGLCYAIFRFWQRKTLVYTQCSTASLLDLIMKSRSQPAMLATTTVLAQSPAAAKQTP